VSGVHLCGVGRATHQVVSIVITFSNVIYPYWHKHN